MILANGIAASGGAVYIASNSTLNGSNVTFKGNQAASGSGGAVYVASGGTMTVTDPSFSGNSASVSGGAIYNNGVVQLSGTNTFANNTSVNGGAVYNQGSAFSVTNGTFSSNTATGGNGGAVYNNGGTLTVTGGTFSQNTAIGDGGAIYTTGSAIVSGSAFTGNQAVNGGAIYNMGSAVVSGSFSSNTAAGGDGGAIYSGGSSLTVTGGSFTGNEALAGDGGAICNAAGSLTVSGTPSFTGNQAGGDGGAIYTGGDGDLSGSFSQNTATGDGGAVYVGGDLTVNGGGFTSNVAGGDGGAVYAGGDVTLSNLAFTGNQATGNGGAVYAAGSVSASNVSFSGNTVADGMDGAAIRADGNALTLTDSSFTGHSNGNSVVFAENTVNAVLNGVTMSGNTVSGAVLNVSNAAATIEKSAFFNNSASQVLSVGSSLYLITSTVAQGSGTISGNLISGTGSMTILNSTLTGSSSNALVQGNGSGTLRLINSILMGTDASQQVFAGFTQVGAAYSIFSDADLTGVNDENLFGLAYADVFGSNTVSADGSIALASDSPAWTGVWSGYDKTTEALYYSVRPDALYPRYGIDTVDWMAFGGSVSRPGAGVTIVASGLNGGTLPSIGSYWAPQNVPVLGIGPGVNITFVNPSWNGIGWNNNDTYNLVSDSLFMNPGFLLNFRSETAFGGNWSYDFIHAFDDRYSTMSGFSVTGGRFDLGFVPSGENYISLNVNGYRSDDFTRYSTTPYLSDGTPLIPEELESMNPETAAPENEGSFDLPEGLEAKVMSYLGRAEIFKNDFDKALDQLLALNV